MGNKRPLEVFMPPNMLKAKVGTGGLDSGMIRRAEAAIDELRGEFADWIVDDVSRRVERRDTYQAESNLATLGELYRASHDLKGQASTFDFPLVARVASSLCKLTDDATNGLELPLALINAHVDAIKVIVREGVKDPTHQTGTVLAGELEKQVGAFLDKHGRA